MAKSSHAAVFQPTLIEALEQKPRGTSPHSERVELGYVLETLAWHASNGIRPDELDSAQVRGSAIFRSLYDSDASINDALMGSNVAPDHAICLLLLESTPEAFSLAVAYASDIVRKVEVDHYTDVDIPATLFEVLPLLCIAGHNRGDYDEVASMAPVMVEGVNRIRQAVALHKIQETNEATNAEIADAVSEVNWDNACIDFCLELKKLGAPTSLMRVVASKYIRYTGTRMSIWRPAFLTQAINQKTSHGNYSRAEILSETLRLQQSSGRRV